MLLLITLLNVILLPITLVTKILTQLIDTESGVYRVFSSKIIAHAYNKIPSTAR
jgi:hypothetical protein